MFSFFGSEGFRLKASSDGRDVTFGSCLQNIHCARLVKELFFPPLRGFQWFSRHRWLEVGSYTRKNGFTREGMKSFFEQNVGKNAEALLTFKKEVLAAEQLSF